MQKKNLDVVSAASDSTRDVFKNSPRTWKEWAGREDDAEQYKFGDLTRGLVSQVQTGLRNAKHGLANTALNLKEQHEQRAVDFVNSATGEDDEMREIIEKTKESAATQAERFWCDVCRDVHQEHTPDRDALAALGTHCHGYMQVEFLAITLEPTSVDGHLNLSDGSRAVQPVCLLSFDGRNTGALHPADADRAGQAKKISSARFAISEIANTSLYVYTFDKGSSLFKLAFEDKAFCGGCSLPLALLIQHCTGGAMGMKERLLNHTFDTKMTLKLLPLSSIRAKAKLEPAEITRAKMPTRGHGYILLSLKLVLNESPLQLYIKPEISRFMMPSPAFVGHVSDPLSVLKAFGLSLKRLEKAVDAEHLATAANDLREHVSISLGLGVWWTYTVLRAPVCLWPLFCVAILPLFAWKLRNAIHRAPPDEDRRLYVDELGNANKDFKKEAVKTSLSIMQLTEIIKTVAVALEKVNSAMAASNDALSLVCLAVAAAAALFSAVVLSVSAWLISCGVLRYILWVFGACLLLPQRWRQTIFVQLTKADAWRRRTLGDEPERRLSCLWQRLPSGLEASHLELCDRYVVVANDS